MRGCGRITDPVEAKAEREDFFGDFSRGLERNGAVAVEEDGLFAARFGRNFFEILPQIFFAKGIGAEVKLLGRTRFEGKNERIFGSFELEDGSGHFDVDAVLEHHRWTDDEEEEEEGKEVEDGECEEESRVMREGELEFHGWVSGLGEVDFSRASQMMLIISMPVRSMRWTRRRALAT